MKRIYGELSKEWEDVESEKNEDANRCGKKNLKKFMLAKIP